MDRDFAAFFLLILLHLGNIIIACYGAGVLLEKYLGSEINGVVLWFIFNAIVNILSIHLMSREA